jgi:hypothetical protein
MIIKKVWNYAFIYSAYFLFLVTTKIFMDYFFKYFLILKNQIGDTTMKIIEY